MFSGIYWVLAKHQWSILEKIAEIHDAGYVTIFATATKIAIEEVDDNSTLQLAFNIALNAQSVKALDCCPVLRDGLMKNILEHRFQRKQRPYSKMHSHFSKTNGDMCMHTKE